MGGANKYKIIDIDGSEITLTDLLDRYFFIENPYTSCSVIETKYYNHVIEESSIVKQIKDSEIENLDEAKELFQQKAKKNHMNVITAINLIQQIIKMIMRNTLYYLMMENLHGLSFICRELKNDFPLFSHLYRPMKKEGLSKEDNRIGRKSPRPKIS